MKSCTINMTSKASLLRLMYVLLLVQMLVSAMDKRFQLRFETIQKASDTRIAYLVSKSIWQKNAWNVTSNFKLKI